MAYGYVVVNGRIPSLDNTFSVLMTVDDMKSG